MLLDALQPRWRALFATAVYTGLRKGELLGLRKSDLDFPGLIMVSRSYDRETNKALKEEAVPMAAESAKDRLPIVSNIKVKRGPPATK